MDFKEASTSDKLNHLAELIEGRYAGIFYQPSVDNCVIGIGERLNEDDTLDANPDGLFSLKFGITLADADSLLVADYHLLGIKEREYGMHDVTPKIAARVLRKLAKKYQMAQ